MIRPDAKDPAVRRRCLVLTLWTFEHCAAPLHELRQQVYSLHSLSLSADLVRGDLTWLQEQGLVVTREPMAMLTERGRDVATGFAPWPGA